MQVHTRSVRQKIKVLMFAFETELNRALINAIKINLLFVCVVTALSIFTWDLPIRKDIKINSFFHFSRQHSTPFIGYARTQR